MPLFYQQDINATTRLGVWKITEDEGFFSSIPLQREITHPHKRLQHLAGRWLLQEMYPGFPYELIRIADTRKPFLPEEQYHFSISHADDYAAAIVSMDHRVGIDVELTGGKVMKVLHKFLNPAERVLLPPVNMRPAFRYETLFWSVKETMFKWHGDGAVDFREHMHILNFEAEQEGQIHCLFRTPAVIDLDVHYRFFGDLCLSWTFTGPVQQRLKGLY